MMKTNLFKIILIVISLLIFSFAQASRGVQDHSLRSPSSVVSSSDNFFSPPKNLNNENFESSEERVTYPLKLVWSPIDGASHYEVEIIRVYGCGRRYFKVPVNALDVMIYPNARYFWRVVALKDEQLLTNYSLRNRLFIQAPGVSPQRFEVEPPFSEQENNMVCLYAKEDMSSELSTPDPVDEPELVPLTSDEKTGEPSGEAKESLQRSPFERLLWDSFWVRGGLSVTHMGYTQEIFNSSEVKHSAFSGPSYFFQMGGFISSKLGLVLNGSYGESEFESDENIQDKNYTLHKASLEGVYTLGTHWNTKKRNQWHLRWGIQHSASPIIEAQLASPNLRNFSNQALLGRLGVGYRTFINEKWRAELNMSYVHPFTVDEDSNNFTLDSSLFFDAQALLNYSFSSGLQAGVFWGSSFQSFDYSLFSGVNKVTGEQLVLINHLGAFVGYQF